MLKLPEIWNSQHVKVLKVSTFLFYSVPTVPLLGSSSLSPTTASHSLSHTHAICGVVINDQLRLLASESSIFPNPRQNGSRCYLARWEPRVWLEVCAIFVPGFFWTQNTTLGWLRLGLLINFTRHYTKRCSFFPRLDYLPGLLRVWRPNLL